MLIADVRVFRVEGVMEHDGEFWEERLVRPIDIYPEHKAEGAGWIEQIAPGKYRNIAHFVEIVADSGHIGIGGPMPHEQAYIVASQLKPLLIGHDPLATERIWDRMYRYMVHGRKGVAMMAMSVVDCALWT